MGKLFLDVETTTHAPVLKKGNFGAEPFYKDNWIVSLGYAVDDGPVQTVWFQEGIREHMDRVFRDHKEWIGHNIGFDMHYIRRCLGEEWWREHGPGRVYDTMVAEHIVNGQDAMASLKLDAVAPIYGGTVKINDIAERFWNKGISSEDIPRGELEPYLIGDIENTRIIYNGQQPRIVEQGQENLVFTRMECVIATIEMEFNGLTFEVPHGFRESVERQMYAAEARAKEIMHEHLPKMDLASINPGSAQQLSAVLFGGTYKTKERVPVIDDDGNPVIYKSGKRAGEVKTKLQELEHETPGFGIAPDEEWKRAKGWATGKDQLEVLRKSVAEELVKSIENYRLYVKTLGTYIEGYGALVSDFDGRIHQSLNHGIAVTGRLTCSNPNLQNVSSKENEDDEGGEASTIKRCFVSRFENGVVMEADYSQLEVAGQAIITEDTQLIEDLNNGIDFHSLTVSYFKDEPYEKVYDLVQLGDKEYVGLRKKGKSPRFARQYGAGKHTIAKRGGITLEMAEKFLEEEAKRFRIAEKWTRKVRAAVERNKEYAKVTDPKSGHRLTMLRSKWRSATGRIYTFYAKEAPAWMQEKGTPVSFKPTEVRNYPIQGFATGDIVPAMIGRLYRALEKAAPNVRDNVKLINTVHDSVILDINADAIDPKLVAKAVKRSMDQVSTMCKEMWDLDVPVTIKAEVTWGPSWQEQTEKF